MTINHYPFSYRMTAGREKISGRQKATARHPISTQLLVVESSVPPQIPDRHMVRRCNRLRSEAAQMEFDSMDRIERLTGLILSITVLLEFDRVDRMVKWFLFAAGRLDPQCRLFFLLFSYVLSGNSAIYVFRGVRLDWIECRGFALSSSVPGILSTQEVDSKSAIVVPRHCPSLPSHLNPTASTHYLLSICRSNLMIMGESNLTRISARCPRYTS